MADSHANPPHTNRLALETSPYLLQHAHNPVDWRPWGPEAFEAARREDKPIFLSVGYSTCYWCHVMERQCFENEAIAAEMNQRFINIKVDREERPDVDQLYMTAVQVLTRQGGWPMSVFLSPDLRPFYGGTYFPPTDAHGRPGFVSILRAIENAYRERHADVSRTADELEQILRQYSRPLAAQAPIEVDDTFIADQIRRAVSDYDPAQGGFGGAPKFPRQTLLELLLVYLRQTGAPLADTVRAMLRRTLDAMAQGGIRDHLGGGFHRYSTDAKWLVPHFEIMLYDNAMLAWCYAESYRQAGIPADAATARGICDFILREMTSPRGLFHTAMDAEVDGQEGLNYLWTAEQIRAELGDDDAELFSAVYGVDRGPNFADPHHGSGVADKNILYLSTPMAGVASRLKTDVDALEARLAPMRQKLLTARHRRKQPLLDTKIITSWNALMIRALAHGGHVLGEAKYIEAAERGASALLDLHRTAVGGLYRTSRDGKAKYDAFLDDYAMLVQALLALAEASGDATWRQRATDLAAVIQDRFGDGDAGGLFFTQRGATDLMIRQKTASDSPLPSGNAVAALALLELGRAPASRAIVSAFAPQMLSHGEGMSAMVQAALLHVRANGAFTVAAEAADDAQDRPLSPADLAAKVLSAEVQWTSPTELAVSANLLRGFHINAHETPAGSGLIATALTVIDGPGAVVMFPAPSTATFPYADGPLTVFQGSFVITIRLPAPLAPDASVELSLTYQACDEKSCLPPVTRRFTLAASGLSK